MALKSLLAATLLATAGAAAGAAVCGAQTTSDSASTVPVAKDAKSAKPARHSRDVILPDEFETPELRSQSVLDVIKRLRPNFLNVRGQTVGTMKNEDPGAGGPHASLDYHALINAEELGSMTLDGVKEIRLLSPSQAQQRFGTGALGRSVILVRTM